MQKDQRLALERQSIIKEQGIAAAAEQLRCQLFVRCINYNASHEDIAWVRLPEAQLLLSSGSDQWWPTCRAYFEALSGEAGSVQHVHVLRRQGRSKGKRCVGRSRPACTHTHTTQRLTGMTFAVIHRHGRGDAEDTKYGTACAGSVPATRQPATATAAFLSCAGFASSAHKEHAATAGFTPAASAARKTTTSIWRPNCHLLPASFCRLPADTTADRPTCLPPAYDRALHGTSRGAKRDGCRQPHTISKLNPPSM